jgi:hypothetical protein
MRDITVTGTGRQYIKDVKRKTLEFKETRGTPEMRENIYESHTGRSRIVFAF